MNDRINSGTIPALTPAMPGDNAPGAGSRASKYPAKVGSSQRYLL